MTADSWRALHDDKSGALQMLNQPLRHDLGHDLICVVDALATGIPQRERERSGKVGRVGGRELVVGQRELPEDDNEPDHAGERGEGGHRRRAQDDALAYAQSGACSGWHSRRAGQDTHDGGISL
jgi:hypothetical protein